MTPLPYYNEEVNSVTPIQNNLFELTFNGKGNNSLLEFKTAGYELLTDREIIIVRYNTCEEEIYDLIESIKNVQSIEISLHNKIGKVIMKLNMEASYIGPVMKQSYDSYKSFEFNAVFKISNVSITTINK